MNLDHGNAGAVVRFEWLEEAPSFIAVLHGPQHRFARSNAAFDRAFGERRVLGLPVREAFPELASQGLFEILDTVYRTGERVAPHRVQVPILRPGSPIPDERFVDLVFHPIHDPVAGGVIGIFVQGVDLTDHVMIQRRQACLVELGDRLRDLDDTGRIAGVAAEVLARALGGARAGFAAARGTVRDQFFVEEDWTDGTVASVRGVHHMTDYGAALVDSLEHGRILVVEDLDRDPRTQDCVESFLQIGTRAYVSVPISDRWRRFAGLMFIHASRPRRWSEADVGLVAEVADRTWAAIQRAEAQRELHTLNESLEAQVRERTAELEHTMDALRQSQKMEALGQLTGGIAHDFNNLLQGILASLEVIRRLHALGRDSEAGRFIDSAARSATRAASLTHRLLAFARRQPLDPQPVAVDTLLATMEDLLRRTLGERIELETRVARDVWPTLCDRYQLENAILNVVINARDAMPDGGRLRLEASNVRLGEDEGAGEAEVRPGDYVAIAVTDTGTGMSAEVAARAFDPFFTTKPLGKGTGLGLSMIYGFARQSGGHARIDSEEGRGTTVTLHLPRLADVSRRAAGARPARVAAELPQGRTVLVAEDDAVVRELISTVLREAGCAVIEARDGIESLAVLEGPQAIDLLVTDIGLPGLDGQKVVQAARATRPALRVLFLTGYAENAARAEGFLEPGMLLLKKPFALESLLAEVRALLDP